MNDVIQQIQTQCTVHDKLSWLHEFGTATAGHIDVKPIPLPGRMRTDGAGDTWFPAAVSCPVPRFTITFLQELSSGVAFGPGGRDPGQRRPCCPTGSWPPVESKRPFCVALLSGWFMSPIGVDTLERQDMIDRSTFYVYCNYHNRNVKSTNTGRFLDLENTYNRILEPVFKLR